MSKILANDLFVRAIGQRLKFAFEVGAAAKFSSNVPSEVTHTGQVSRQYYVIRYQMKSFRFGNQPITEMPALSIGQNM